MSEGKQRRQMLRQVAASESRNPRTMEVGTRVILEAGDNAGQEAVVLGRGDGPLVLVEFPNDRTDVVDVADLRKI